MAAVLAKQFSHFELNLDKFKPQQKLTKTTYTIELNSVYFITNITHILFQQIKRQT